MAPDTLRVIQWFAGYNPPPKKNYNNRPRQVAQISSDEIEARVLTDDTNEMDYAVIRYPRHGSKARRNGGRASGDRVASAPPLVPIAAAPEASSSHFQSAAAALPPAAPAVAPAIVPITAPAAAVVPITAATPAPTPAPALVPTAAPAAETQKEASVASVTSSRHASRSERMAKAMRMSTHPECDCANCGMGRFILAEYDLEPRGAKRHDGVSDKQPAQKDAKSGQPKDKENQDKQEDGKQNQGQKQKAKKSDQENNNDGQGSKKADSSEEKKKADAAQKKADKPAEASAQPQLPVSIPAHLPELPEGHLWVFDPATRAYFPKDFRPAKAEAKAETADQGAGKKKGNEKVAEKKKPEKPESTEMVEAQKPTPVPVTPQVPLEFQFHLHSLPSNSYDLPYILEREAARLRSGRSTATTEYEDLVNKARFRDFVIRTYGEEAWEREEERRIALAKKEGKGKQKVNNQNWASKSKEYDEAHPGSSSLSGSTIGVDSGEQSGNKAKEGSQSGDIPSNEWTADGGDSNSKKDDAPSAEWAANGNVGNDDNNDATSRWGPDTSNNNDENNGATFGFEQDTGDNNGKSTDAAEWGPSQGEPTSVDPSWWYDNEDRHSTPFNGADLFSDPDPEVPNSPTENDKKTWIDPTVSVPGAWGSWGPPSQVSSKPSTMGNASQHTKIWSDVTKPTTAPSSPISGSIPNEHPSLVSTIRSRCTSWVRTRSWADLNVATSGNESWIDPSPSKTKDHTTTVSTSPKDRGAWIDPASPKTNSNSISPKGSGKTSKTSKTVGTWIGPTSPKSLGSFESRQTPKSSGPTGPKHVGWAKLENGNSNDDKKEQDPETWSITATVNPSTTWPTPETKTKTKDVKTTFTSRFDISGFGSSWK